MIPLQGLNSLAGLTLVDATRDRQLESIRNSAQGTREINTFLERIGNIETVDQLLADRELYVFVMKAYDLENQIFGKALVSKILKSDASDPKSLVNRLTDQRFKDLHAGLDFLPNDAGNNNTIQPAWQNALVDRFVKRQFINIQAEQNQTIGIALKFREKAPTITSAFDFLKDLELSQFIRTAVGIPSGSAVLNIDRQAKLIDQKLDYTKLKDPAEVQKLILNYVAIQDAQAGVNTSASSALQLLNSAASFNASGQFVPITIDITAVTQPLRGSYT